MTPSEFGAVPSGLYLVYWRALDGGGSSEVAIGRTAEGHIWFAPTNWIAPVLIPTHPSSTTDPQGHFRPIVPEQPGGHLWNMIERMDLVYTQH